MVDSFSQVFAPGVWLTSHIFTTMLGRPPSVNNSNVPVVMKPGSLDSFGDVEYYGFYIFALPFLVLEIFNF